MITAVRVLVFLAIAGCSAPAGPRHPMGTMPDATPADASPPAETCPAAFATGSGRKTGFASAGQSRSYELLLPSRSGPRPLLFVWHGTGLSGSFVVSNYGLDAWRDAGWIVVAPDSNGNGSPWPVWDGSILPGTTPADPNPDLALFDDLIACIAAHRDVDSSRIFVAGHSAGGVMANYVMGRRSDLLAGGITASGALEYTQPEPPPEIDPMAVIVTWGGDNDVYSGTLGGTTVHVSFAETAAVASQYWETRPGTHQIHCRGHELGHAWLTAVNPFMMSWLEAHPKGQAIIPGETLPADGSSQVTCSEDVAPIP